MRTARTLLAGAALTACLAFAAPAAHATGAVNAYDPGASSSVSGDSSHGHGRDAGPDATGPDAASPADSGKYAGEHGGADDGDWNGHDGRPHGGLHTGGGGMSMGGGGSMAAGSVLLLGGLGAGAFVLRRRRTSAGALA